MNYYRISSGKANTDKKKIIRKLNRKSKIIGVVLHLAQYAIWNEV